MENNVQQNEWEGLFESFLDLTEFSLEYHKDTDNWGLYDRQGGNLGDIQSDRFENAGEIFERMDVYLRDYIFRDLQEEVEAYKLHLPNDRILVKTYCGGIGEDIKIFGDDCCAYWIAIRSELGSEHKFIKDHKFEFDMCEMIRYHWMEINLNNVYHEEV